MLTRKQTSKFKSLSLRDQINHIVNHLNSCQILESQLKNNSENLPNFRQVSLIEMIFEEEDMAYTKMKLALGK